MRNLSKLVLLSFGIIAIGLSTITLTDHAFAANHCNKNHDKNCNHSNKNQNSSPKINCKIHIDVQDHLNNNDFGPTNQQCQNNSNNIKDSTVTQTSPGDNNGDFTSPTVTSTDPSDGDNNVPLNTKITVNFNEKIDENTIDTGSLDLFNLDGSVDPFVQSVSTSSKSATFSLHEQLLPNTHYEATISSNIEDTDGNSLDCSASNAVDSNCQWQFSTSGGSPAITISPSSGSVLTSVDVTGNGFTPLSVVTITFDGNFVDTVTTTSVGSFIANFNVPLGTSIGDHTVKAAQGSNSASKTFKVTNLVNPIIFLHPDSGQIDTNVSITGAGFDPSSTVTITFNGTTVDTIPATVTTTSNGFFFANFTVPASSIGPVPVIATQGSNTASKTFTVTLGSTSLAATSQSSTPNLSEKMILPDIFA